jgi:hypothetical protein
MNGWSAGDAAGSTNDVAAITAWDRELAGLLRFASCQRVFPVSIAYPAWSHPVLDLDHEGFGTLDFPHAFTVHREPLAAARTPEALRAQALEGFRRRERERTCAAALIGARTPPAIEPVHAPARSWVAVGHGPRLLHAHRLLWAGGEEVWFAAPPAMPSFWRITARHDALPPEQFRRILRSFVWLDPLWFAAAPSF